jgi:lipopolysaccharide biosynthesis glycosyltransferase
MCPIVLASDENYAMPLATTLRSVCDSNETHWPLEIYILTDHFSATKRKQVESSLPVGSARVTWMDVDTESFRNYELPLGLTPISLARLDIPRLFEARAPRVLYLDSDLLVLGSLAELCGTDLGGAPIGAVVDTELEAGRHPPPPGLPNVPSYFNSGVLLYDVAECVRQGITERALSYLRACPASPYPDQDALNVACADSWKALDVRFNFQAHLHHRIDRMPVDQRPAIVHFVTSSKPWRPSSVSRNAALYDSFRDRTVFRRPALLKLLDPMSVLYHRVSRRMKRILGGTRGVAGLA